MGRKKRVSRYIATGASSATKKHFRVWLTSPMGFDLVWAGIAKDEDDARKKALKEAPKGSQVRFVGPV